ncbi:MULTISPECIES: hypothetical protein [unclassified Streptomyces]|uniref:hypothetical protein n=1 Tax=unclassified Streptomyces TaxID=2593676 RepID=UPI0006FD4050|nr:MULTISPECIES: hypothetical protein [unclassified Streptomyces]KQX57794.1 hypothetical protein ASD33_25115 [Streptomyces sp. Root1304]KRA78678.1 hypothetical protein ASE09_22670 [Streptomyces sp. Root66D1]
MAHPRPTPRVQRRAALAVSGWVALAATALPGGSPLRWIPVLAFVALGPGLALLLPQPTGLRPGARLEVLALAAPVSLSVATLVATALFLGRSFSLLVFMGVLALFVSVAAVLPGVPLPAATRGAVEREGAKPSRTHARTPRFRARGARGGGG